MGKTILLAAALLLCACGQQASDEAKAPPKAEIVHEYGWLDADSALGTGVVFKESPDTQGFLIQCLQKTRALQVTVANPVDAAPQAGERASLQLGAVQFEGMAAPAGPDDAKLIVTTFALTPQVLIALGDSKTARLAFRDATVDAGVDAEGRLTNFAKRCAALTGVEPAL